MAVCLQVLVVGPTGTGKSLAISDKLTRNMPKEFLPEFITFSAKTSANQTQDLIDGKLDKRFVRRHAENREYDVIVCLFFQA